MYVSMIMDSENDFPRGGKKISTSLKRKRKDDALFGNIPKKQKKGKKSKKENKTFDKDDITISSKILLRQSVIEGMTLLACVKKITEHALEVELPGLIIGKVMIDSISDTLVETLKQALSSSSKITSISELLKTLFHCGQYVPLKIKSIHITDDKSVILGSISPKDINCDRIHNSFKKGELLWASVVSELDHGYQLDCGVANCRIFLPNQNIEENIKLKIGQPIWCKVHRVDSDNAASTLRVGAKRQHIDSILTDESISISSISPGTKVEVFVEKVAKNGICCKFLENYSGFIHESQLDPVMRQLKTIKESSTICAYLLYVENITKIAHLSMRSLDSNFEPVFDRGTKLSAEVIGKNEIGIYFKLNKKEKGWISNKRILSTSKTDSENKKYISENFKNGSKHQCVVLSYNHMDRVYVCGIEKELLKEKYFSSRDLKVGEMVKGKIQEVKNNGVVLVVGQVKGFIPNIHLTDALYSDNLKKKFVEGKSISAKVFSSNEKSVIFTLKSSFIKDNAFFNDLKAIKLNKVYPALVLKAKSHGLALTFYNNIEGYVPFKEFNFRTTEEYKGNPSSFFYSGQVIKVRAVALKGNKVVASLKLNNNSSISDRIGNSVCGIVKQKKDIGLLVLVKELNMEGFIPLEHLSIDLSLCRPMLETFKENDEITDLMILKVDDTGITLSRRETIAYERCDLKVPKFQNIKKNTILRCSIESVGDNGIYVYTPIKNFNKRLFVKNKNISRGKTIPEYQIQQSVLAKVLEVNRSDETIELSLKPEIVFDKNAQNSTSLFIEYLRDEELLQGYGTRNNWPINQYSLCEIVSCIVVQCTNKGCLVELPNGSKGLVVPSLSIAAKKGAKIKGMVLGFNYQLNYVELCLDPSIMKKINPVQDGAIPEGEPFFTVNKLLTREQYILAVTRNNANRQLVYIPLRLCENDPHDSLRKYYENDTFKVEICGKHGAKLIGLHRKLKYSLDYTFILKNTNWSELDSSLLSEVGSLGNNSNNSIEESDTQSEEEILECDNGIEEDEQVETQANEDDDIEMVCAHSSTSSIVESGADSKMDQVYADEKTNVENQKGRNKERFSGEELRQYENQIYCPLSVLPPISNFFSPDNTEDNIQSLSDNDDEEVIESKKKNTTTTEKKRNKVEESKKLDGELDPTQEIETGEYYEKLIMNNPNSSTLWLKYIAFCLSVQEFEKARNIGRRALASINITCEDDKFNIWMTLLSIENLYGSKESFESIFEEAVRHNDALKVYLRATDLLFKSEKHMELEEKIRKMRMKFKQESSMWVHVAKLYYLMGNFKEARNIKNLCLKSITTKKEQYNLILKFAILEFTHGEIDAGILIFESVLVSYPNKIGTWMVYIDQLISKKQIKEARDVLNRAIALPLPLKSAKAVYHKYRMFEENYGTPDTLALFKEKAKRLLEEKLKNVQ